MFDDSDCDDALTPPPDCPPTATTPGGPVWTVDADDAEGRFHIRRLPDSPGLLKLGATLHHTGASSHPRLQAPTKWWRDRDDTWVATPEIRGVRLSEYDGERPTWSVAVDAITPLALALRDAHQRGLVHGALAPWNVFFDDAKQRLSATDFGLWPHELIEPGPFCPVEMRTESAERTPSPATDIHNLARILIDIALSSDEARRNNPNFETLPAYAISTLERALRAEPEQRPQSIDEFLAGLRFEASAPVSSDSSTSDSAVTGRVRGLDRFNHDRRGEGIRFRLDTAADHTSPGVFVYRNQHPAVFDSLALLWEGAELTIIDAQTVENSDGDLFLTATDATLPVIEPHWPVSVSDVLKARGCPQRVMVDKRDPGERTHHLAFGTLVHQFLEDLTADDSLSFEDALEARLPALHLDFLASGVDDAQLSKLVGRAREQFEHLRRFTARRTAEAPRRDRVGWCGEHAEATRYSSRYGLEGRTDLVVTDPDEGLQIIELKSGKPWHDHAGQVQSYALLWRDLASQKDLPTSGHLLYSKNGRMKEVPLDANDEKETLVHGRNGLIALYRSYVDPTYDYEPPHYMQQPALCRENACRFRRDRCGAQTKLLDLGDGGQPGIGRGDIGDELGVQLRQYHRHLTRLIEMERWTDHTRLGAIFQPELLAQRINDNRAAADLELVADDTEARRAILVGDDLHIFTPGDRILVHRGDIDSHHVFRARVIGRPETSGDADAPSTRLQIELRAATLNDEFAGPGWIADDMPSRIGYRTAHRALYRTLKHHRRPLLETLLRPDDVPVSHGGDSDHELHQATADHLNDSQKSALRRGLVDRPATLIQGPPGTGKTTVIAHLCCELSSRGDTVLLSALTNTAVDTLCIQLLDAATRRGEPPPAFLRLSSSERSPLLADALRRRGLDVDTYFADDMAAAADSLDELRRRLETISIVATTAHSSLRHAAMTHFERLHDIPAFDVALIDEASQLTEPMALAPISAAHRFVLVGDHRQLPPIVTSERAMSAFVTGAHQGLDATTTADAASTPETADGLQPALFDTGDADEADNSSDDAADPTPHSPLEQVGIAGLDRSLFERLAAFFEPSLLTTQYRMHRDIMDFPARAFYDGRLVADDSVADRGLELGADIGSGPLDVDAPVVFVDIDGTASGRTNIDEARALVETTKRLVEATADDSTPPTIGALSPFRAQVHLLRRLHRRAGLEGRVDVDTVERFQGNERDVICATLVKTDHPGDFVADVRRLNVALTRPRKKLIIFGCRRCLVQNPTFRRWLDAPSTRIIQP